MGVEIERKFTVRHLPEDLDRYPFHTIEQGYLNVDPAIRVRREDDSYYMTYKNKGMYAEKITEETSAQQGADGSSTEQQEPIGSTEYNLPLDKESYEHMLTKADGNIIRKKRYLIPAENGLTIELDVFDEPYKGTIIAEVEFPSEEAAAAYKPAEWFDEDVTGNPEYSNAKMSKKNS